MTNTAVFPLALVRDCLRAPKVGATDHRIAERFGYIRAKRMTPAVVFAASDLSRTHCGELPLVAWVGYRYSLRAFNTGRGCYINTAGQHVYPA